MRTVIIAENGRLRTHPDVDEISQALMDPQNVVWLDIQDPTEDDIALLSTEFNFHPLAIEDATRSHERPKVDAYGSYYFLVFYTASYQSQATRIATCPINLFIGANYLVTVHAGEVIRIRDTMDRWQAEGSPLESQTAVLVHALLDALVDDYFPVMDAIADRVEELEDAIFREFHPSSIQAIFGLKKDLVGLRRVIAPERDVLNTLLRRELPIFRQEDLIYLMDVYDHITRVIDSIDTDRDLLSSALDSYLSLQSNSLNQVMKLLTMASIVLMSNALIAGIYGMNFRFLPELGWQFGYPWALTLMVLVSTGLIMYFRRRNWF